MWYDTNILNFRRCVSVNHALSETLTNLVRESVSPNLTAISFALMKDGQPLAAGAVGTRDGRADHPAKTTDLYNIGSISKVYVSAAIMKLCEMGKLELDAPVVQYLPRFTMADPRYKDITVRMCLCHRSGLPGTHWKNSFTYSWLGDTYFDECYEYFAHSRLKAAPGEYTTYCNDGFTLAEMVAVEVSGMPLSDFLRKYFLVPLGALSTCASDRLPIGHDHVVMKSAPRAESLSVVGAGGINSDMLDVCRFGNSFLNHSVLSKASCDEMGKPHGLPQPPQDTFSHFLGLGWDRVAFESSAFDLGPGVLMKSGGTAQFLSFLVVAPKYGISAAISGTMDTGADHLSILCRLIARALKETEGLDISRPSAVCHRDFTCVPDALQQAFAGFYATPTGVFQVDFSDDTLSVFDLTGAQKRTLYSGLRFCDGRFYGEKGEQLAFIEHNGFKYLFSYNIVGVFVPTMQKIENLPPLPDAWKARDGRRYFFRDAEAGDLFWGMTSAIVTLKAFPHADGIMLACLDANPDNGQPMVMPLAADGDNLSRMFLNGSASASRDQFAAEFSLHDGAEEMYLCGMRYRDISCARQPLETGDVVTKNGEVQAFAIPEGRRPAIYVPDHGRLLLVSREFHIVYDSYQGGEVPDVSGGYALFAGADGARFSIVL